MDASHHLTLIPKYRKKQGFGDFRKHLNGIFKELFRRRGREILEGHLMPDYAQY